MQRVGSGAKDRVRSGRNNKLIVVCGRQADQAVWLERQRNRARSEHYAKRAPDKRPHGGTSSHQVIPGDSG